MNFEDVTLVRLADPASRRDVFDDLSLQHVLEAAFDTSAISVEGPYDAVFDEVRLGAGTTHPIRVEGSWANLAGTDRVEARFEVAWPPAPGSPRADLVWLGAVVARAAVATSAVDAVTTAWPDLASLDDDIATLPEDPAARESARRAALMTRLRAGAAQPDAVDDRLVDRMLDRAGVATVGELAVRHAGDLAAGRVRVRFAAAEEPPPTARRFPVAVALLVRDGIVRVGDLLADSAALADALGPSLQQAPERDLVPRRPVVVGWVLPAATFDDDDWPGAEVGQPPGAARQARRAAAATWLSPAGIALVAVDAAA